VNAVLEFTTSKIQILLVKAHNNRILLYVESLNIMILLKNKINFKVK